MTISTPCFLKTPNAVGFQESLDIEGIKFISFKMQPDTARAYHSQVPKVSSTCEKKIHHKVSMILSHFDGKVIYGLPELSIFKIVIEHSGLAWILLYDNSLNLLRAAAKNRFALLVPIAWRCFAK